MSLLCECGNRKTKDATACMRCEYLDGNKNAALVVAALRQLGSLTVRELADETRSWPQTTQRTLQRMLETGRVRRFWREADTFNAVKNIFAIGGGRTTRTGRISNDGCWVYALTESA